MKQDGQAAGKGKPGGVGDAGWNGGQDGNGKGVEACIRREGV